MTGIDKLAERHIIEHESHLKRIDELLARGEKLAAEEAECDQLGMELTEIQDDREKLSEHIQELKKAPAEYWQKRSFEKAGPMGVWDAVAQRLEGVLESVGGKSKSE